MAVTDVATAVLDRDRLAALRRLVLLDTPPTQGFDRITAMVARLLRAPMALLTLVDADRQWFKSSHGLSEMSEPIATARQTPLAYSVCQHVVATGSPLVISDADADPELRDHPAVREFGIVAYAGVPLFSPDGYPVGTLCALDVRPRHWTSGELANLGDLAAIAMREIALHVHSRLEVHRHLWRAIPNRDA